MIKRQAKIMMGGAPPSPSPRAAAFATCLFPPFFSPLDASPPTPGPDLRGSIPLTSAVRAARPAASPDNSSPGTRAGRTAGPRYHTAKQAAAAAAAIPTGPFTVTSCVRPSCAGVLTPRRDHSRPSPSDSLCLRRRRG